MKPCFAQHILIQKIFVLNSVEHKIGIGLSLYWHSLALEP